MTSIVFPYGTRDISVAASDKISLTSQAPFKVWQLVGYPNQPNAWSLLDSVDSEPYTYSSSAFTSATTVRVEAGALPVYHFSGTAANAATVLREQGAPVAMTTAATITSAALAGGLITGTHSAGATAAYTLPTGAVLDAAVDMAIGQSFDFTIINLSAAAADTITLTAPASGITLVGVAIVASAHATTGTLYGNSATWRMRKTAAETFICYRVG